MSDRTSSFSHSLKNELSWTLSKRQLCDLELILSGAFYPLTGFMGRADYTHVITEMRLTDKTLWPIPITLDIDEKTSKSVALKRRLLLRNTEGIPLALLRITDLWKPDLEKEATAIYGSTNGTHPGVAYLLNQTNPWYVGGALLPLHSLRIFDFPELRHTPNQLKKLFAEKGWKNIIAFQTRNPMHRVHYELTLRALKKFDAGLLIHPVIGETKPGDIEYCTRVRCYQALLPYYPPQTALLSLLPLAMRMAGPKEALWHAIIRKNFGCTHFIVGRDHAGPGVDQTGQAFYGHYAAQKLLQKHEDEIGIETVPFETVLFAKNRQAYLSAGELNDDDEVVNLSGTELRNILNQGQAIPDWFTFPEVAHCLQKRYPARSEKGITLFFTGLSGSGKSTLAQLLQSTLIGLQERKVTLLDGDLVRRHLSSELTFSKEHRNLNILRLAFVASKIAKHGGITLCSAIAPFEEARKQAEEICKEHGSFILIHVSTPIEICEERDCKGLYEKARAGLIPNFTGINDPYEQPPCADVTVDTSTTTPTEGVAHILNYLQKEGYLLDEVSKRETNRDRSRTKSVETVSKSSTESQR